MKMIEVNNVSMRFNMAKEKHESLKEYFLAAVQGKLQFEEFYALRDVSLTVHKLSLIHISEPTRQAEISYAVFCLKKKKRKRLKILAVS